MVYVCQNARSDERGISLHYEPFYNDTRPEAKRRRQKWVAFIKKKLHDRNERQASVQMFARTISLRKTSAARFIYSETECIFYGNSPTLRRNVLTI